MKKLLPLLLLSFWCLISYAQNPTQLTGLVIDTNANAKLYMASISLLNAKDSTLVKYTRADVEGKFSLNSIKPGKYLIRVAYPEYADYVNHFELSADKAELDFGNIILLQKANLLNEIIIKGQAAAIKIKGDTTEFNASSYTIKPNDRVEDLIKKFEGITVDQNGKITANGKAVQKVLLDGEEFFGDDPTLLTRNIRADMIDKVQLYEKKSDQAVLTGIDDGQGEQTLNFTLKEDMKKGMFGKVELGGGSNEFNTWQAMLNRFNNKLKFSLYGVGGNTGKIGLSWADQDKYSGGIGGDVTYMDDGGMMIMISGDYDELDSFEGQYAGSGIPQAKTGGFHFSNKWAKDKYALNFNYKLGQIGVNSFGYSNTQRNLPSGSLLANQDNTRYQESNRHKIDGQFQIKLDSLNSLKINFNASQKNGINNNSFETQTQRLDFSNLNSEMRKLNSANEGKSVNFSALYTKLFKKKGRNFSAKFFENYKEDWADGFLLSQNSFYNEQGILSSTETTDQKKNSESKDLELGASFTYNEPVSKTLNMVLTYGITAKNSEADRDSYNKDSHGNYTQLDAQFSNHFETQSLTNSGGLRMNYAKDKTTINGGINVVNFNLRQKDLDNQKNYTQDFVNLNPSLTYRQKISNSASFSASYNGRTQQPSISQLQPIRVNDDVLNIPIGNPNLKSAFNNQFNASYNSYKILSGTYFYMYGSYNLVSNTLVNNSSTDLSTGKSTWQTINLKDKLSSSYNIIGTYSKRLKNLKDIEVSLGLSTNGSKTYAFINNQLNQSTTQSFGPRFSVSRYAEGPVQFSLGYSPSYVKSVSSINKDLNNNGYNHNIMGYLKVELHKSLSWTTDFNNTFNGKTVAFDETFQRNIINTSLEKTFFDKKQLTLIFTVNDLLNENNGFSRSANSLSIVQSFNNTINRYFLLTAKWDFTKMGPNTK